MMTDSEAPEIIIEDEQVHSENVDQGVIISETSTSVVTQSDPQSKTQRTVSSIKNALGFMRTPAQRALVGTCTFTIAGGVVTCVFGDLLFIIMGAVSILAALIGYLGAWKRNRPVLGAFMLGLTIATILDVIGISTQFVSETGTAAPGVVPLVLGFTMLTLFVFNALLGGVNLYKGPFINHSQRTSIN